MTVWQASGVLPGTVMGSAVFKDVGLTVVSVVVRKVGE